MLGTVRTGTKLRSRPGVFVIIVPFLAGLCAVGATLALSRALTSREELQLSERAEAEARHFAAQVRAAVMTSLDAFPRIAEWWLTHGRPTATDEWTTDAQLFLRTDLGLRNVVWLSPSGAPLWCVKPGTNPDFRCSSVPPALPALARQSVTRRSTLLSEITLRDNAPQFFACVPIRRKQAVGVVAATFDAAALVQSQLKDQFPAGYAVRIAANGDTVASLPYTGAPLWQAGSRTAAVKIANRWWSVELTPAMSDIRRLQRIIWSFGVIVSVLIYVCSALALIYRRNESTLRLTIAERRRAEQQIANLNRDLQNRVDDFEALLDALPVGIAVSDDPECRHIWVNPRLAAMLGTSVRQNISFSGPDAGALPYRMLRDGVEVPASELPMQVAARTGRSVSDVEFDIVR